MSVDSIRVMAPAAPAVAKPPAVASSFPGIPCTQWIPFDCAFAAGPNHLVCALNSSISILSKTGAVLGGQSLDGWFANVAPLGVTIFDPKLIYDHSEGHFILLACATGNNNFSAFFISISQSSDPTGQWWNHSLDATLDGATKTANWADYPSLGQDSGAIYITANMFQTNGPFQYAKVRIIAKSSVYTGGVPAFHDATGLQNDDGSLVFTLQPCNTFGASPVEYLVNSFFPTAAVSNPDSITLWTIANGAVAPVITSQTIKTVPYGLPPHAEQPGGAPVLDSGDTRILNAIFAKGSIWAAFNTQNDWGGGTNVAALHWLQIDPAHGAILQQGIYGAQGIHYFYPGIAPDDAGNAFLVFSRSSLKEFASLYCAGRATLDPSGLLSASVLLKAGLAPYTQIDQQGRNRWGDYAGIAMDPADGKSVWLNSGYAIAGNQWATQIARVKI